MTLLTPTTKVGLAAVLAFVASGASAMSDEKVAVAMYSEGADGAVTSQLNFWTTYDPTPMTFEECEEVLEELTLMFQSMSSEPAPGKFVRSECIDVEAFRLNAK